MAEGQGKDRLEDVGVLEESDVLRHCNYNYSGNKAGLLWKNSSRIHSIL